MDTDIIISIAGIVIGFMQTFDNTIFNDVDDLVVDNFKLVAKWVTYFKLFVNAYSGLNTKESEMFGFVCLLGFLLHSYVITTHINSNHKAWTRISISGMAILSVIGVFSLKMVIPDDHAWHNTAVETIRIFFLSLEACLLVHSKINEVGDDQNLLRDILIKLVDTVITSYRFADSKGKTHSPWDVEKVLHLVGAGLPVLIGACQIGWKVIEWRMKIPRVSARKTEQKAEEAARATMGGNEVRDARDQVADERIEVENGLPVTVGASQVDSAAYSAGIKFKVVKWFRQTRRVSAAEDEHAAGAVTQNYGGGDSGQQVQEDDVKVVVGSQA